MYDFLCELDKRVPVGLVGGSDHVKISEQMGGCVALHKFKHVFTENGLVAYEYDKVIGTMVRHRSCFQHKYPSILISMFIF